MKVFRHLLLSYIRTKFKILSALSKKKAAESAFDLFCTPPTRNTTALHPVFRSGEPLAFQFGRFTIRGFRWNAGSERRVLIVHGFESSIVNFHQYIEPLTANGFEIYAFDAPAHGLSTGSRINALVFRDFILEVISRYGPMNAFISHSFGGLALSLAMAQTKHDLSTKLVLLAPATESTTALKSFLKVIQLNDPAVLQELEKIIHNIGGHSLEWFSVKRAFENIRAKTLWVHDRDDRVTPLQDALPIQEKNYPNLHFVITEGLGHSRLYRDPGVITNVTSFISG